jgi:chromosome segregation ATPase
VWNISALKSIVCQKLLCLLLLCSVLSLVLPLRVYSLDTEAPESGNVLENRLGQLIGISTRLADLNETLRNELDGSRKNSEELRLMLAMSRTELETLKAELDLLRMSSAELTNKAEISQTELTALQTSLTKAETSLTSLEKSFTNYRQTAELRMGRLERSRGRYRTAFFTAAAVALGGIAFGAVGLAGR